MKILTIKLTAPLQSYGNEATFERRTTADYPTKSAVVGMIAAALGYRRSDQRILALNELKFAVRIDQTGRTLTDFQTVEWKANTRKVTYRDYLQDAVFMVAVGSQDETLIEKIDWALHHPRFQLFLGRRSNAPAGVLRTKLSTAASPVATLKQVAWQAIPSYRYRHGERDLEIIADADLIPDAQGAMVKDQVRSFAQRNRQHGFRAVAVTRVNPDDLQGTEHDVLAFLEKE